MIKNRVRRRLAAVAVTCAAGLGLVACSSDDRTAGDATTSAAVDNEQPDTSTAPVAKWVTGPAGLSYPVSDTAGPASSSPVPHGFKESPQGAVVAAVISQVFISGADDELWPVVSQTLLEPGLGRDQWAQARALMSVGTEPLADPPVFRGFVVNGYTDSSAVVTLAVDYPNVGLAAMPVQMSRSSGDWKVVLPTQEQAPDLQEVTNDDFDQMFTAFGPDEAQEKE